MNMSIDIRRGFLSPVLDQSGVSAIAVLAGVTTVQTQLIR
jgi:hypothetical protein